MMLSTVPACRGLSSTSICYVKVITPRNIANFSLPLLTYFIVILIYSQDYEYWLGFVAVIIVAMGILFRGHNGVFLRFSSNGSKPKK